MLLNKATLDTGADGEAAWGVAEPFVTVDDRDVTTKFICYYATNEHLRDRRIPE